MAYSREYPQATAPFISCGGETKIYGSTEKVVIEVDDAEGLRALGIEDDLDQPQEAFEWFCDG